MSGVQKVTIAPEDADQRLDRWFRAHFPEVPRSHLEKLLRTGQIRVDGRRARSSTRLAAGQMLRVPPLRPADEPGEKAGASGAGPSRRDAALLREQVLFRDETLIAINKPQGLAVQGGSGQTRHLDGMLDALRFGSAERPRLTHRLDKDTSGVLVLARTRESARRLAEAFRRHSAVKLYWAAVVGQPPRRTGQIRHALAKGVHGGREKVGGDPAGKSAVTLYHVVCRSRIGVTWLALLPLTGRTHQIRAHCAAEGMPILGDGKYGGRAAFSKALPGSVKGMALHARELALPHPEDGTTVRITAPLSDSMAELWDLLGWSEGSADTAYDVLIDLARSVEGKERVVPPYREEDGGTTE